MEKISIHIQLNVGRDEVKAKVALGADLVEAAISVNGQDTGRNAELAAFLAEAIGDGLPADTWEHTAIRPGALPERLRVAASGTLRFIEKMKGRSDNEDKR